MKYFTKKFKSSDELNAELKGVRKLQQFVRTPEILEVTDVEIKYELIKEGQPDFKKAGKELHKLHQVSHEFFGLNENNFIGKNTQINTPEKDCKNFYLKHRIGVQVARLKDLKIQEIMNELVIHLEGTWFPNCTRPSLCHGDLWGGNLLFDEFSNPVFIDPAIYFGDPLSDIAMAYLFGGFSNEFFNSYMNASNRTLNRLDILVYQLYHSLNHVNIFGASYNSMVINQTKEIKLLL